MPARSRSRTPMYFGEGLDRESGLLVVEPVSFADLRNVLLHEGKAQLRAGFTNAGVGLFDEIDTIVGGQSLKSDGLGIIVGYNSVTERVYVYRTNASMTVVELLGEWVHDLSSGWGSNPPRIIMAEVFGRVFMAHDISQVSQRARTIYYDPITGAELLNTLTAAFAGTFLESGESGAPESESVAVAADAIRFRGVVRHLQYLVGWGFGTASEVRPELVRISLPGIPQEFDENHYFVAGDRRDPVLACAPAGDPDGPQGILDVWKSSEAHAIHGYDRSTFGIRLIDPRHGIVSSRAWVNVEGLNVAWAEEGPRLWEGMAPSRALEIPLALDAWEPSDLVDEGELVNAFATYVPRHRVAWFIFGRRVYALTARIPGRWRWSYQQIGFDAYAGFTLFETIEQTIAPAGYPSCDDVEPAGTFANITVGNHQQAGDETLEVWIRATPSAGDLDRTTAGKIARRVANDGTEPLDDAEFSYHGTSGIGHFLSSGVLEWDNPTNGTVPTGRWQGVMFTPGSARQKGMVQVRHGIHGALLANMNIGCGMGTGTATTLDFLNKGKRVGPSTSAGQRIDFVNKVVASVVESGVGGGDDTGVPFETDFDQTFFMDVADATEANRIVQGYNTVDNDLLSGQPTINVPSTAGKPVVATFASADHDGYLKEFYYHADRYVTFGSGIPDGWKCQIRDGADAVIAEEVASGGGAVIDLLTEQLWQPDCVAAVLLNEFDVEVGRSEPSDGVWGGDFYTFTPASAGEWELIAQVAVTTAASQLVQILPLATATAYDVALRYRRGVLYNAGAEDTDNPQTWPSVSRCSFSTTVDPPTLNSLSWERTSGVAEQITLSISPLAGETDEDIEVWRAPDVGGAPGTFALLDTISGPHSDPFDYDDATISGETAYWYALVTAAGVGDSPMSEAQRAWAGPAAIPVFSYKVFGAANLPIIGFTTTAPTLVTEYLDTLIPGDPPTTGPFVLRNTMAAGETEAFRSTASGLEEEDTIVFEAKIRHKATAFSVDDFGEFMATVTFDWPADL